MMKISIATDHNGVNEKKEIIALLSEYEFIDKSTNNTPIDDYPDFAYIVAKSVINKEVDFGVLLCGTGIGMSIAANKVKGIRCALCHNEFTAKFSRLHNNANVLAMGADDVTVNEAICMIRMWIATEFEGGRHEERVKLIGEIENKNMK